MYLEKSTKFSQFSFLLFRHFYQASIKTTFYLILQNKSEVKNRVEDESIWLLNYYYKKSLWELKYVLSQKVFNVTIVWIASLIASHDWNTVFTGFGITAALPFWGTLMMTNVGNFQFCSQNSFTFFNRNYNSFCQSWLKLSNGCQCECFWRGIWITSFDVGNNSVRFLKEYRLLGSFMATSCVEEVYPLDHWPPINIHLLLLEFNLISYVDAATLVALWLQLGIRWSCETVPLVKEDKNFHKIPKAKGHFFNSKHLGFFLYISRDVNSKTNLLHVVSIKQTNGDLLDNFNQFWHQTYYQSKAILGTTLKITLATSKCFKMEGQL